MKKKELRQQIIIVNDIALRLQEKLSLVAYENRRMEDFLIKIGYTQDDISGIILNSYDNEIEDLNKSLTMVKLENQMLRKTLYSQEEELKNYDTLWGMYAELKKENKELLVSISETKDDYRKKHNLSNPFDKLPDCLINKGE